MQRILTIIFLNLIALSSFSQSSINGSLLDASENQPIEYGSVAVYQLKDSTLIGGGVTNENGNFRIEKIKAGEYYLIASFLGYESKNIGNFTVEKNKNLELKPIVLTPNQKFLEELEISGKKATTIHKIDRQVYEADKFQSSQGGTATDIIRNMPSVNVNGQGDISVRGSSGFVVMINGKPVQTDPSVILNQLPANAVENVEIITAPSAKYDPEGKAGMINIITKKGAADGLFLMVNGKYGLPSVEDYDNAEKAHRYGGDFTLNYRKDKWDISLGASYLRNDIAGRREGDVYTISGDTMTRFPSDGERSFDEYSYSGRFSVAYTPNEKDSYNIGFYGGKRSKDRTADILYYDNHAVYIPSGERLYTYQYYNENLRIRRGDFALGSFDYSHKFDNKSSISTSFLYEYTMLGGPTTNKNLGWPNTEEVLQDEYNTNDNPLNGIRFQLDYQVAPLPFGDLEFGYQYRNLDHKGDFVYQRKNLETGDFELVPEFSSSVNLRRVIHSGYGQLSGEKDKWSYELGMRLEMMDRELDLRDKALTIDTTYLYDFVKLYPSANLVYQANDELKLKAAYSKRVERTTTFKMNPFPEREHSETLEQGDPELLPEFIDLVELGVVKDFGDNSVFVTGYFRNVQNLINRVNTVFNDTILNRIYSNVGRGRTFGVEFGSELNPKDWWGIYAGANLYNTNIKGEFDNKPIDNSSWMYSINANTTFALEKDWTIQLSVNYLSDRITAQGEDSRFLSPNLTVKKTFMDGRLTGTFQWLNIDMGMMRSNEQRITTFVPNEFYTTTNYVYEVDVLMLNLSYTLNKVKNKAKFIKSEFGEKEF
ncbi:outer membrane beta-barrel family protein [Flexithrix dorotheae]|uniref:outer membrane beta-barrel family protein n=1 Tax=Flexithrix dorotheae TaxID=70993 RepID=UPI000475E18B|nr:outer membrane beta-barrel family protein [Flexithrix dorotheae]